MFVRWCLFFWGALSSSTIYAVIRGHSEGLGRVAQNVVGVEQAAQSFLQFLCVVTGIGLLLGSLVQFKSHRKNPVSTRLSKPIAMVLLGLALTFIAFIPMRIDLA